MRELPMDLSRMAPLRAEDVRFLVFHTVQSIPGSVDISAVQVNRYHIKDLGWAGIGYHWLIRLDGTVEPGRPLTKQGAHVKGLNDRSIAIAFSGNGDTHPLTPAQMASAADLGARLVRLYKIDLENVIGHRDVNTLINAGVVPERDAKGWTNRTPKSCPGVRVKMRDIRAAIERTLFPPPAPLRFQPRVPEILDKPKRAA